MFHVVYEYPERDLTVVYSATLSNGRARGKVFMGHDGAMEVGSGLRVIADRQSTRYEDLISAMDNARSYRAQVEGQWVFAELFPDISIGDAAK